LLAGPAHHKTIEFSLKNEVATCRIGCEKIQILLSAKSHVAAAVPRLLKTAIIGSTVYCPFFNISRIFSNFSGLQVSALRGSKSDTPPRASK